MSVSDDKIKLIIIGNTAESLINFRGSLIRYLVGLGHNISVISPECTEEQKKILNSFGVKLYQIPIKRTGLNPLFDIKTIFSIYKVINTVQPKILITYALKPIFYGAIVAKFFKIHHFPILVGLGYTAGYTFSEKLSVVIKGKLIWPLISLFYKFSLFNAHKVLVYNEDIISLFLEKGLIKNINETVLIRGSGVDVDYYFQAKFPDSLNFLLIARLLSDKGLNEYYNAAKLLKLKYPEVNFNLVGFIDERNPTAISQKQLDLWVNEGIINFLGKKDDVRPSIQNSSVYVLPSYHEGIPRSVLEAMAMGRPVITTDTYGCRETVTQNLNGYLIPIKDTLALVNAMESFILNPSLIEKMGEESRELAVSKFSTSVINESIARAIGIV